MGADVIVENVNTLPKFKDTKNANYVSADSSIDSGPEFSELSEGCKVWTVTCDMVEDVSRGDRKFMKGPFSKGSTLMKPTASQLAKQNRLREVKHRQLVHRFPKPVAKTCEQMVEESSENTGPAAKRQKLEGGRSQKVGVKEQTDLLHKAPQKKIVPVDVSSQHSRLRITIPREPELETARRACRINAQRLRSTNSKQMHEEKKPIAPIFIARPLNRKILEAPSLPLLQKSTPRLPQFQPFNLKTEERALQHSSGPSSFSVTKNRPVLSSAQVSALGLRKLHCQPSAPSQLQIHEKQDDVLPKFKARPLNRKILSSKGDIGVLRSCKRETTKPKEFHFSTDKRCQQDPPTELFNKLSLNTEAQQSSASRTRSPWPFYGGSRGWKENINHTVQQGHKDVHVGKEDLQRCGISHVKSEVSQLPNHRSHMSKLR